MNSNLTASPVVRHLDSETMLTRATLAEVAASIVAESDPMFACSTCRDVGCYPSGPEWRECTCEAGDLVREHALYVDDGPPPSYWPDEDVLGKWLECASRVPHDELVALSRGEDPVTQWLACAALAWRTAPAHLHASGIVIAG